MVAGGRSAMFDGLDSVEILQLDSSPSSCQRRQPKHLPISGSSLLGLTNRGGHPMVCGGGLDETNRRCLVYQAETDQWLEGPSLVYPRKDAAIVRLSDGRYWITGGRG